MLLPFFIALRPRHWVKNLFLLPALVFSRHLFEGAYLGLAWAAVGSFCLLSSAVYLLNDVCDREQDRRHPEKAQRPIAAGLVPVWGALAGAVILAALALVLAFFLQRDFGWVALIYLLLNLSYSLRLKHVVLVDVMMVAACYLLRAVGGGVVLQVSISTWFVLCSFTLALFLAVVKRRQELVVLEGDAGHHRAILNEYSVPFLDQIIAILTSATLVCYALYAMGVGEGGGGAMQWTIPFVLYGLLRYLYIVHRQGGGANPTAVIWGDRPLQINLLLWLGVSIAALYGTF
ncbi:MAG: decaprenyl-phosphate phosphoribosyltransferase [Candidatus Latescibacteria bacterium]|nr:decaprenyl-phosphate phosphoribosyltransferase [Candidatus Latescibacterota bacterium]